MDTNGCPIAIMLCTSYLTAPWTGKFFPLSGNNTNNRLFRAAANEV